MSQSPGATKTTVPAPKDIYQKIVQSIHDYAIFMLDPAGYITTWTPAAERIKGYTADEAIGMHFSRFYPEDRIAQGWPEHELEVAAAQGRFEDEGLRVRKDGTTFHANVIITALTDDAGNLIGFAKITRDLTERIRHEHALRASEERFRALIEDVADYAIFMLDPEGKVATWNAGAQRLTGYNEPEVLGAHMSLFYPQDAVKRRWPQYELEVASLEGRFEDEGWRVRKDGSRFWANVVISALRDDSGKLLGFVKITRDLTERRLSEEALKKSEERFRLLVEAVSEYAIVMLDSDGLVSSWNLGAQRIYGYKSDEIVGRHFSRFHSAESVANHVPWKDLHMALELGRSARDGWSQRKDGSLFWASSSLSPLYGDDLSLYGFAFTTQDLTERRNAESLAETANRMNVFLAMLAHELRNPIAPIRNAVALMAARGIADPVIDSMRQIVDRQSLHLARIVDDLLDANRIARDKLLVNREIVDVCETVRQAIETSQPLMESKGHRLHVDLPPAPVIVQGDFVRLTQACVNLLNNAAKYTPRNGHVFVQVRIERTEVAIRVRDTGIGISSEDLPKVFDLFTQIQPSTHAAGGLGVGLALVQRVVQLHGGTVTAGSEGVDRGSVFEIRLARARPALRAVEDVRGNEEKPTAPMKVLVVDDNEDAAVILSAWVQEMGHTVRTAFSGKAAVSIAELFLPDVIFLDVGMPGMSGYEVAAAVKTMEPRPALVAVTGWGQPEDRDRSLHAGIDFHFVKPISEEQLRKVLREVASRRFTNEGA